jgi:hypothetical protein
MYTLLIKKTTSLMPYMLIVFSLTINIWLLPSLGTIDAKDWAPIFDDVATYGHRFIAECLTYHCPSNMNLTKFPPGYFLLFYLFSFVFPVSLVGGAMSAKVFIFVWYLLTGASVVWFARYVARSMSVSVATLVYLTVISLVLNTQGLAYTDIVSFPFFVLSIGFLYRKNFWFSGMLYALSVLVKWQPIVIAPVYVVYVWLYAQKTSYKKAFVQAAAGAGTVLLGFCLVSPAMVHALIHSMVNALGHHTTNALNIPWIIQHLPGGQSLLTPQGWPIGSVLWLQLSMFIAGYGWAIWRMVRAFAQKKSTGEILLQTALVAYTSYFFLSFGVHENHFIFAIIVALLLYVQRPSVHYRYMLIGVDVINTINMFLFYGVVGEPVISRYITGFDLSVFLAWIISGAVLWYGYKTRI